MPHLTLCFPTGNAGLGKETVLQLAKHNEENLPRRTIRSKGRRSHQIGKIIRFK
jgi:hypothetical protein